jgi:CheY-like chemotaxis protein
VLALEGHRVAAVPDGADALHLLQTLDFRPCVIIADLVTPEMDGLAFHAELRRYPQPDLADMPVIALTGYENRRRKALAEGFAAALLKPCRPDELFQLIDRHCRVASPRVRIDVSKK